MATSLANTRQKIYTCMAVDDEEHALTQLVRNIEQVPFLQLAYALTSPVEAMAILNTRHIDILFLDVEMPYLNGIEFAKMISEKAQVILCTAHMQYAVAGFEANVQDYLLKPVTYSRLLKAVNKVIETIRLKNIESQLPAADCIFIKADVKHRLVQVNFTEIEFIERVENYSCLHISEEKRLTLLSLTKLEELLPAQQFIRVHASYIVPVRNIAFLDANSLTLKQPAQQIPISAKYKQHISNRINSIS